MAVARELQTGVGTSGSPEGCVANVLRAESGWLSQPMGRSESHAAEIPGGRIYCDGKDLTYTSFRGREIWNDRDGSRLRVCRSRISRRQTVRRIFERTRRG